MANLTVTNTFVNGVASDAGQVNTNFTDVINGTSDGTIDFSIAALTLSGALTANGNVTLGNGGSDDVTITGSLASSILLKTDSTLDIGSSTKGLNSIFFGENSQRVAITGSASMSATYTITLPVDAGVAGQVLHNIGSGALSWVPGQMDIKNTGDANYTILDADGFRTIVSETTLTAGRSVILPVASSNTDRIIAVKKGDSGAFTLTVTDSATGADLIDGAASWSLENQYDMITVQSNGSTWHIIGRDSLATASQMGNISSHETHTIDLSTDANRNQFTGGILVLIKMGKLVTMVGESNLTHANLSSVNSNAGIIPANFRPTNNTVNDIRNCYYNNATAAYNIIVKADGQIGTTYQDDAGAVLQTDSSVSPTIQWTVP